MPPRGRNRRRAAAAAVPLPRIQQLGLKVIQNGDTAHFTLAELDFAADEAIKWEQRIDNYDGALPPFWITSNGVKIKLHALHALTLRRSCAAITPAVGETFRAAYAKLCRLLLSQLHETTCHDLTFSVRDLRVMFITTLRGHALRGYSGLLHDAAAQLSRPTFRRTQRSIVALTHPLEDAYQLLDACRTVLARQGEDESWSGGPIDTVALAEVLREELLASRVLEHWSRLLLLLTTCEVGMNNARLRLFVMSTALVELCEQLGTGNNFEELKTSEWLHRLLEGQPCFGYLLSSHVLALCATLDGGPTYGLPRDSPLTYGENRWTPTSVSPIVGPSVAPLFGDAGQPLLSEARGGANTTLVRVALMLWDSAIYQQQGRREQRDDGAADPVVGAAAAGAGPSAAGGNAPAEAAAEQRRAPAAAAAGGPRRHGEAIPDNTRAVFALCMRLAAAATAGVLAGLQRRTSTAATAAASSAAVAAVLERTRSLRMAKPVTEAPKLARLAFLCGRRAVSKTYTGTTVGQSKRPLRLMGRWWAAMAAYVDAAAAAVAEGTFPPLTEVWEMLPVSAPRRLALGGLPPMPAAWSAAALGASYLPSVTRALQALGDRRVPPWYLCFNQSHAPAWAWEQLLAFGPASETAPLVSTVVRLLTRAASRVPAPYDPASPHVSIATVEPTEEEHTNLEELCNALDAVRGLYEDTLREWSETVRAQPQRVEAAGPALASAASAADVPEGLPRLSLMMSYLTVHLLPAVSSALVRCVLPTGGYGCRLCDDDQFEWRVCESVMALLSWVALLAAAQVPPPPPAEGAVAMSINDAWRLAPSPAAEGWRALLLRELHVPELLGIAIRAAPGDSDPWDVEARQDRVVRLSRALRLLMIFAPVELAAALTSPRAALAAHLAGSIVTDGEEPLLPLQPPPTDGAGLHPFVEERLELAIGKGGELPRPELLKLIRGMCSGAVAPDAVRAAAVKMVSFADGCFWRGAALLVPPARLHQLLPPS